MPCARCRNSSIDMREDAAARLFARAMEIPVRLQVRGTGAGQALAAELADSLKSQVHELPPTKPSWIWRCR
jgi:hypothetical protein